MVDIAEVSEDEEMKGDEEPEGGGEENRQRCFSGWVWEGDRGERVEAGYLEANVSDGVVSKRGWVVVGGSRHKDRALLQVLQL